MLRLLEANLQVVGLEETASLAKALTREEEEEYWQTYDRPPGGLIRSHHYDVAFKRGCRSPHTPCCPRVVLALYWAHTEAVGSHHVPFKFSATELRSALCTSSWDAVSSFDPRRSSHVGAPVRSAVIAVARY